MAEITRTIEAGAGALLRVVIAGFLFFGAWAAQAHDPGLSSAHLALTNGELRASLTFAPGDITAISGGKDHADWKALAGQSLEIWFDGLERFATQTNAQVLSNNDLEFSLVFPAPPAGPARLRARSPLLDRLPFGHRQYLVLTAPNGAVVTEKLLSGSAREVEVALPQSATAAVPPAHPFSEFLGMGVKHILSGYDHLLFLFALLIGCARISSVIKVITAFTVAHSISLALATVGWVEIPSRVVEPLIAATIVFVSVENLARGEAVSHRTLLTFGFGLVHGFGFAGALREMGVGSNGGAIAVPLLAFNCGVEIGQMMVAGVVLPILWQLKDRPQFRRRWAPACCVVVALAGSFWFIQRVCAN